MISIEPAYADIGRCTNAFKLEDCKAAEQEMRPLAEAHDARAEYYMALIAQGEARASFFGAKTARAREAAMLQQAEYAQWMRRSAEDGFGPAMIILANDYYRAKDPLQQAQAFGWYSKAASLGEIAAMAGLGDVYRRGINGPPDKARAREWYLKAAAAGDARGNEAVADLDWQGRTGLPDVYANSAILARDASNGDANAQAVLARQYWYAIGGVYRDETAAFKWAQQATAQDNAAGEYVLGLIYDLGINAVPMSQIMPRDASAAARWMLKAAEQGYFMAQLRLAENYGKGDGVAPSALDAVTWFAIATSYSKIPLAGIYRTFRDSAAARLTPQQLKEVQEKATVWQPRQQGSK